MLTNFTTRTAVLTLISSVLSLSLFSQTTIRAYQQIYSDNIKGATAVIGNSSMHIVNSTTNTVETTFMNEIANAANGQGGIGYTQYGNDFNNMQFADIDGVAGTYSSTSADLALPAGTNTIKFARLYWGGRIDKSAIAAVSDTLRKVRIRKGTGAYSNILAAASSIDSFNLNTTETIYQCYVDVTTYIQTNGAGTYTVANIPATPGDVAGGGKYAGWCLVVVYQNTTMPLQSIRLYDGYYQVFTSTTGPASINVTLNNLNVPNNTLAAGDAVMSALAWEGDGNLGATTTNPSGDFVKVNGVTISNAANLATNFWNGSITKNGAYVNTKNPNYANQMGLDIDEVNVGVGYGILPNATSVNIEFGTEADQYFPSLFAFSIRMKDPLVTMDKTVADASGNNALESNEILTYTLSGTNTGAGTAYNVFVVDSIPNNVSYIAGSMEVVAAPGAVTGLQTDAIDATDKSFKSVNGTRHYVKYFFGTGSTNAAGGSMASGQTYTLRFKVRGQTIPGSVTNTATAYSHTIINDRFTDDGTAVIGPSGGPTPVKLSSFNAKLENNKGMLYWTTDEEINSSHFVIERSKDGLNFESKGNINSRNNSAVRQSYNFADPLAGTTGIVYYRLKMVDLDGKYAYSKIIPLKLNGSLSVEQLMVYPNPFAAEIKVFLKSVRSDMAIFRIISLDGKEQLRRNISIESGENIVVLKDLQQLPAGNYLLEIHNGTDKYITKIVKNK